MDPRCRFLLAQVITRFNFGGKMAKLWEEEIDGPNPLNTDHWSCPVCFSVHYCRILKWGDHTVSTIPLHPHVSAPCSWEGLGQELKSTFLFPMTNPGPYVPCIYTLIFPFRSLCFKYPQCPTGPTPNHLPWASLGCTEHHDLCVICHLESRRHPGVAHFPSPHHTEKRRVSVFWTFMWYVYNYCFR